MRNFGDNLRSPGSYYVRLAAVAPIAALTLAACASGKSEQANPVTAANSTFAPTPSTEVSSSPPIISPSPTETASVLPTASTSGAELCPAHPELLGSRFKPSNADDINEQLIALETAHGVDTNIGTLELDVRIYNVFALLGNAVADPAYSQAVFDADQQLNVNPNTRPNYESLAELPDVLAVLQRTCTLDDQPDQIKAVAEQVAEGYGQILQMRSQKLYAAFQQKYQDFKAAHPDIFS